MNRKEFAESVALLPPAEILDLYFASIQKISLFLAESSHQVRVKPIFSPSFGYGRYSLASRWAIEDGLDVVSYYVVDTRTRLAISVDVSKADALGSARGLVKNHAGRIAIEVEKFTVSLKEQRAANELKRQEANAARRAASSIPSNIKSIPKRRKKIFDESAGACHYCGTALTLDGKWHIEHKMPKALLGGNDPGNLVASCVTCNHRKKDKTDVEFKAQLQREASA